MRSINIAPGEYYHIFNRGVDKKDIFLNKRDYVRFLFLIMNNQSPRVFSNLEKYVDHYIKHQMFNVSKKNIKEIGNNRLLDLVSFCIMPNHFHILVREKTEKGISQYMQRCLNAYSKYYNTKYKKSGHVFQGPYKAVHVETNAQLLYLSSYIHRNPIDIKAWKNNIGKYPWSSLIDYIEKNRWDGLIQTDIILNQFKNKKEYINFVESSPAKNIIPELLMDVN